MKVNIYHTSYIVDFPNSEFSTHDISVEFEKHIQNLLSTIRISESLNQWKISINIIYSHPNTILLFRKTRSIDNEKEISIHIPIPTSEQVSWGVEKEQHIVKNFYDISSSYYDSLEINPKNYNDMKSFIFGCITIAIEQLFIKGFTINRKKIKL